MADEDPPNIIPFGKHKGKTIQEVQIVEPGYLDWLEGQPWFRDKFVILHQTIINRGAEPEETPDHNALQVLFLDDAFCLKFIGALGYDPGERFNKLHTEALTRAEERVRDSLVKLTEFEGKRTAWEKDKLGFEWRVELMKKEVSAAQVSLTEERTSKFTPTIDRRAFEEKGWDVVFEAPYAGRFRVEIKPSVSDDYPAVLRQINTLNRDHYGEPVLFLERYIGVGATREQFIAIFKQAGISVIFRDQVE